MADEIDKIGRGFLNSAGQIKDKKALAAEDSGTARKTATGDDNAASAQISDKSIGSALNLVRTGFSKQVNSLISVINQHDANLEKAGDNIKAQINIARDLKKAIRNNDGELADQRRQELEALQVERNLLADQIKTVNDQTVTARVKTISFGNKPQGTVTIRAVEFEEAVVSEKLDSAEDVDALIKTLKEDRKNIRQQRKDLEEVKASVASIVSGVRQQIVKIERSALNSAAEAQKMADKLASDIVKAGSQGALVSNINEEVVKSLLAA